MSFSIYEIGWRKESKFGWALKINEPVKKFFFLSVTKKCKLDGDAPTIKILLPKIFCFVFSNTFSSILDAFLLKISILLLKSNCKSLYEDILKSKYVK